mmetsp:Transcript_6415/g.15811  ORF Transcript_6415/g.15811 Transcript_6415/m.15811 type:complete len:560 (-) Transcript_6415:36-1715(-)
MKYQRPATDERSHGQPIEGLVYGIINRHPRLRQPPLYVTLEAIACAQLAHFSELVVAAHQENVRRIDGLQRKEQDNHLYLMFPSVDEIAIEDIRRRLNVAAAMVRKAELLEEQKQVPELAVDVAENLGGHVYSHHVRLRLELDPASFGQAGDDLRLPRLTMAQHGLEGFAISAPVLVQNVRGHRRLPSQSSSALDDLVRQSVLLRFSARGEGPAPATHSSDVRREAHVLVDRICRHDIALDFQLACSKHRDGVDVEPVVQIQRGMPHHRGSLRPAVQHDARASRAVVPAGRAPAGAAAADDAPDEVLDGEVLLSQVRLEVILHELTHELFHRKLDVVLVVVVTRNRQYFRGTRPHRIQRFPLLPRGARLRHHELRQKLCCNLPDVRVARAQVSNQLHYLGSGQDGSSDDSLSWPAEHIPVEGTSQLDFQDGLRLLLVEAGVDERLSEKQILRLAQPAREVQVAGVESRPSREPIQAPELRCYGDKALLGHVLAISASDTLELSESLVTQLRAGAVEAQLLEEGIDWLEVEVGGLPARNRAERHQLPRQVVIIPVFRLHG